MLLLTPIESDLVTQIKRHRLGGIDGQIGEPRHQGEISHSPGLGLLCAGLGSVLSERGVDPKRITCKAQRTALTQTIANPVGGLLGRPKRRTQDCLGPSRLVRPIDPIGRGIEQRKRDFVHSDIKHHNNRSARPEPCADLLLRL